MSAGGARAGAGLLSREALQAHNIQQKVN
jgi:Ca2+-binding EF-hand superfamily protein